MRITVVIVVALTLVPTSSQAGYMSKAEIKECMPRIEFVGESETLAKAPSWLKSGRAPGFAEVGASGVIDGREYVVIANVVVGPSSDSLDKKLRKLACKKGGNAVLDTKRIMAVRMPVGGSTNYGSSALEWLAAGVIIKWVEPTDD